MAGIRYFKDLPFALLIQTMGFVVFNKVCTAQYFVWWMAILPLALTNSEFKEKKRREFYAIGFIWLILEVSWNFGAYLVEIKGENAFLLIFVSCIAFFVGNVYLIRALIMNHNPKRFVSMEKVKRI
jgi:phosphatidylinositol glycan class M